MSYYFRRVEIEGTNFNLSEESGALVVYCKSVDKGYSVKVWERYKKPGLADATANVVERKVDGEKTYVAVFPRLKPETYHIELLAKSDYVTVFPGEVAEVDWR